MEEVVVERLPVVHAVDGAVHEVLAQRAPDGVAIGAGDADRQDPGAGDRHEEERPQDGGEAPPAPQVAVRGQGQEGDAEGQQEPDGALGQGRQRRRQPEQQTGPATVGLAGPVGGKGGERHPDQEAQQGVDLGPAGLVPEHVARGQHDSGEGGDVPVPEATTEAHGQGEGAEGGQGRGQARRHLQDLSEGRGESGDQPEEEGRLVAVHHAVDEGHEPVAPRQHLPRPLREEGLVRRPQVVAPQEPEEEDGGQDEDGSLAGEPARAGRGCRSASRWDRHGGFRSGRGW